MNVRQWEETPLSAASRAECLKVRLDNWKTDDDEESSWRVGMALAMKDFGKAYDEYEETYFSEDV